MRDGVGLTVRVALVVTLFHGRGNLHDAIVSTDIVTRSVRYMGEKSNDR